MEIDLKIHFILITNNKITVGNGHVHQLQIILIENGGEKSVACLVDFNGSVVLWMEYKQKK